MPKKVLLKHMYLSDSTHFYFSVTAALKINQHSRLIYSPGVIFRKDGARCSGTLLDSCRSDANARAFAAGCFGLGNLLTWMQTNTGMHVSGRCDRLHLGGCAEMRCDTRTVKKRVYYPRIIAREQRA